mgnify:FL=1
MTQLITTRLILRIITTTDTLNYVAFEERNKDHFTSWSPAQQFSHDEYQNLIDTWVRDGQQGNSARFFLFLKDDAQEQIIGMCNFSNIIRGPFQACYLGYKIDHAYEGKGLMFEALQSAIAYMFDEQNLHRIMANYMPINIRSGKLLQRLGFSIEGEAKQYLLINGIWADHILTSLINPT